MPIQPTENKMEYVYFIRCNEFTKIGITNDIDYRLRSLQTGNPYPLELLCKFEYANALPIEGILHKRFSGRRVQGEWFKLSDTDLSDAFKICGAFDESGMVFGPTWEGELLRSAVSYCFQAGIKVDWEWENGNLIMRVEGVNYDPDNRCLVLVDR
jgi:hypothetical protein